MSKEINPRLKICVKIPSHDASLFKVVFQNSFEIQSDLKYDYQKVIDGLRCLFPDKKIIIELSIF